MGCVRCTFLDLQNVLPLEEEEETRDAPDDARRTPLNKRREKC